MKQEMHTILLIGDNTAIPYARALEAEGFEVKHLAPGAEPPAATPAAVIVDTAAVGEDPLARRYLEETPDTDTPPLIALFAPERIEALDPARSPDDFLVAGATAAELCARVRRVLYQRHGVDTRNTFQHGDLVMDLGNYTVHIAGRPVELTYKEYELLRFLATNRGRVFTRETLLNKVWGYHFYGGARTVDVHIRRLRAKIEDRHTPFIETVRNVGYRFRTA
jgi:two-component system, OmpR family, alkaline phosphatase synthesis response regulator PhoP